MAIKVPRALASYREELEAALTEPLLAEWDDEVTFADAPQVEAIAHVLVDALHSHLANAQIGFLFKKEMKKQGTETWAQMSKVAGKLAHFSHLEFLGEFNWSRWKLLTPERRIALVDHELSHCGREETDTGDRYVILPHDLEEFNAIARRWGSWRPQIAHFASALGEGQQIGLFPHD